MVGPRGGGRHAIDLLRELVTILFVVLAFSGTVPVLIGVYQYALIPLHGVKNHLPDAAPYLPRVVVIVPAWNEGAVLTASLERLMRLEYPPERLRVYVVDDASTDNTPEVTLAMAALHPGRIFHLRRAQGGEGKAHTLNHGIRRALADDWAQAVLIMDADVVFRPDSLRRMTRHLADERVGAVTGYIKEGSLRPGRVARFIGYEYITAQAAARRAQNVLGAVACLAGGAQLHSRANLEAIGGEIDTSSLAEDTFTTFLTQLGGRRVVFEPDAVVLAEEPDNAGALWKQRLRWARGNVHITRRFRRVFFRPSRSHRLGSISFGLIWYSLYYLPVAIVLSTVGLLGLYVVDDYAAASVFSLLWWLGVGAYVFITAMTLLIDPQTARRSWLEGLAFPGIGSIIVMVAAWYPEVWREWLPSLFGLELTATGERVWLLVLYSWGIIALLLARLLKSIEQVRWARFLSRPLLYFVGFGPMLCAITVDAYIQEWRGADQTWDKTEKTGRVVG
ncbi:glycosyltransferase [Nocardioides insulae]|uniref:glycosyltransferase n=1 Tax=Nocardioides insulae TaxID=394734 RepID=UPI00040B9B8D|nr:glycosyltransferase [Nocardioides insulae]